MRRKFVRISRHRPLPEGRQQMRKVLGLDLNFRTGIQKVSRQSDPQGGFTGIFGSRCAKSFVVRASSLTHLLIRLCCGGNSRQFSETLGPHGFCRKGGLCLCKVFRQGGSDHARRAPGVGSHSARDRSYHQTRGGAEWAAEDRSRFRIRSPGRLDHRKGLLAAVPQIINTGDAFHLGAAKPPAQNGAKGAASLMDTLEAPLDEPGVGLRYGLFGANGLCRSDVFGKALRQFFRKSDLKLRRKDIEIRPLPVHAKPLHNKRPHINLLRGCRRLGTRLKLSLPHTH